MYLLKYFVRKDICALERKPLFKPPNCLRYFCSVAYFWWMSFQVMNKLVFSQYSVSL